jgi:hypothetical protein
MGFLEYAWAVSLQKDNVKTRIFVDPKLQQPTLTQNEARFNITLPAPSVSEEETLCFLGYEFPADSTGKAKIGRLFRACVLHLTAHTLMPIYDEKKLSSAPKHTIVETFSESLVNDAYVNSYISARYPDKLADLAFANSLAFAKMKPVERIFNPATRIMAALLSKINIGIVKGVLRLEEANAVDQLTAKASLLKEKIVKSLTEEKNEVAQILDETANHITQVLESHGPILEAPSLQYTEQTGPCSIFSQCEMQSEQEMEGVFRKSLETLGGKVPSKESIESCWGKEAITEASQAFDTWINQKAREERILTKLKEHTESTRFKFVGFPDEDYTQYLRARILISGGSRRLLDSLRVAQDALDEDPGKEMGQLDLTAVVQMVASGKKRTDVFMKDEYLSRSFAWGILFDASASMKIKGEFGRALTICVAEATKELLMDSGAWTLFAFNDSFYVLKDASEAYSHRVRSRIGGLKFCGLTYMPDAIKIAGEILMKRLGEQKFLVVISDGWPYGYPNILNALSESIDSLQKKGVIVIGVGLETERMKNFFKLNCAVHNQKDLIKEFAKIYVHASGAALET